MRNIIFIAQRLTSAPQLTSRTHVRALDCVLCLPFIDWARSAVAIRYVAAAVVFPRIRYCPHKRCARERHDYDWYVALFHARDAHANCTVPLLSNAHLCDALRHVV